ncbi:NIPSNAP family protein [Terriglobus tenax]|uniref:NIPSNAP family protein n=1 Tax=Terriglobus tenax TaxID=1111115 RepID=UPI0021E0DA08|nr:NIPSNAP family protein [Terriglobus tenax]
MKRREFIRSAAAGAVAATVLPVEAQVQEKQAGQEFYELRRFSLRNGAGPKLTENFFAQAMIPALNHMGISPVGAFKVDVGPEMPTYYLLLPSKSAEALLSVNQKLSQDAEFLKAAAGFWDAPAAAPAFLRVESTIFSAFTGWPKLTPPKPEKRIFQLRIYESASYAAHLKKVEMFNTAEIGIFVKAGLAPVFFGSAISGPLLPNLTYMLTFPDLPTLSANWSKFGSDPAWKELSHKPGYTDPEIVTNISNYYLSPLACSQV